MQISTVNDDDEWDSNIFMLRSWGWHSGDNYAVLCEKSIFPHPRSCSPGFTNYWMHGCYKIEGNGNWSKSEARCQEHGPNVHLADKKYLW